MRLGMKVNFSELSRIYKVDRRTIKSHVEGKVGKERTRNKKSYFDKYEEDIKTKLKIKGVTIKGVHEYFIDKYGEFGTYSNFLKYVRKRELKPKHAVIGHPRFETQPGIQVQVDWKEDIRMISRHGVVHDFNVLNYKLGFSRHSYFGYSESITQSDLVEHMIMAFIESGGVPREALVDNMSAVVNITKKGRKINSKMKAFADDFGFRIRLCKPYHAFTKGKVEANNKFLTRLLAYNHDFEDEEDLRRIIKHINKRVNESVSQATGVTPNLLFQKEKEYLLPLPKNSIIESYLNTNLRKKVQKDSLISYKGSKYSVPQSLIGKTVSIKEKDDQLHIYHNTELIRIHPISSKKFNYYEDDYRDLMSLSYDEEALDKVVRENLKQLDLLLEDI
jgi:transposase